MTNQAIGLIDSGIGGLTVMKEAIRQLPNESFYYVGDTARCPYGPRPMEQVKEFTWEMTRFLMEKDIKMLVVACNTATAAALDDLKKHLDIPVVGVIQAGSRAALKVSQNKRIGIIGTEGTVKSGVYHKTIKKRDSQVSVTSLACPKFVPLVESNEYGGSIAKKIVNETLRPLKRKELDTLVLGCTHYPLLKPIIQNAMGKGVTLIDSGAETVSEVGLILDTYAIEAKKREKDPERKFFTTGSTAMFEEIASQWLQLDDLDIKHIKL